MMALCDSIIDDLELRIHIDRDWKTDSHWRERAFVDAVFSNSLESARMYMELPGFRMDHVSMSHVFRFRPRFGVAGNGPATSSANASPFAHMNIQSTLPFFAALLVSENPEHQDLLPLCVEKGLLAPRRVLFSFEGFRAYSEFRNDNEHVLTCAHLAARHGSWSILPLLKEWGHDVHEQDPISGMTPGQLAFMADRFDVAVCLGSKDPQTIVKQSELEIEDTWELS